MKKAFYISLSINFLLIIAYIGKRMYYSHFTLSQIASGTHTYNYSEVRESIFSLSQINSNDIVFVGNSLTEKFIVSEIFSSDCKNRGIGGNKVNDITKRISSITRKHPRKIFLECGINDLFEEQPEVVFANYKVLISKITSESPESKLYIQSVLPADTKKDEIVLLNKLLKSHCDSKAITFINLYPFFETDGYLRDSLTYDKLHLNGNGYAIWADKIRPYM